MIYVSAGHIRVVAFSILLCLCTLPVAGQDDATPSQLAQRHAEAVSLNERLRTELAELNSHLDRVRVAQRWALALVGLGAFGIGFVLGYVGRHSKDAAKQP